MIIFVKYVFKSVKIPAFRQLLKVNYVAVMSWRQTIWHVLTNIGAKSNKGKVLKEKKFLLQKYIQNAYNLRVNLVEPDTFTKIGCSATIQEKPRHKAWFQLWSQLTLLGSMPCSREICLLLGRHIVRSARYWPQESPKFNTLKTCKQ